MAIIPSNITKRCKAFLTCTKAQSTFEFAVVLPLLLLLIYGMINIGLMLNAQIIVTYAAREGARAGAVTNSDSAIRGRIKAAIENIDPSYLHTEINITPAEIYRSRGSELTVSIQYEYTLPIKTVLPSPFHSKILSQGHVDLVSTAVTRIETD